VSLRAPSQSISIIDVTATHISTNAIVLSVTVQNEGFENDWADIGISSNVYLDDSGHGGGDSAPLSDISPGLGFQARSNRYQLTFICRGHPLVTDVATYWFGRLDEDCTIWQWLQKSDESDVSGVDSAMGFSWQNISVPPGETATESMIIKFGPYKLFTVCVTWNPVSAPSPLYLWSSLSIAGSSCRSGIDRQQLYAAIDDRYSTIVALGSSFPAGSSFAVDFSPSDVGSSIGLHRFSFYVINQYGDVSSGQHFDWDVIAPSDTPDCTPTPSDTPSETNTPSCSDTPTYSEPGTVTETDSPTETMSPTPTVSSSPDASQTPLPSQTPGLSPTPSTYMLVSYTRGSFDIAAIVNTVRFPTSYGGYYVRLPRDGYNYGEMYHGNTVSHDGVTLSMSSLGISENAVVLRFRLVNSANSTRIAGFNVYSQLHFCYTYAPPVENLSWPLGFYTSACDMQLTFVCGSHELVTNVSSYVLDRSSSVTIWWRDIEIASGASATRSMIVKLGAWSQAELSLNLTVSVITPEMTIFDSIGISGSTTSTISDDNVSLWALIDDVSSLWSLGFSTEANSNFDHSFLIPSDGLSDGTHLLSVYAINQYGDISPPVSCQVRMIGTGIPAASPLATVPPPPATMDASEIAQSGSLTMAILSGIWAFLTITMIVCSLRRMREQSRVAGF
jgi:hypothetical protein